MALNQREKFIAVALGIVVFGVVANAALVTPYLTAREQLVADNAAEQRRLDDADKLIANHDRVRTAWKNIIAGGLKTNATEAQIEASHAFRDWAQATGVTVDSEKSDQAESKGDYQEIHMVVNVVGNMRGLSRWLWNLETSPLPLQVGEFRLSSRKEGTDDLSMQVNVTALVFTPQATTKPGRPAQGGAK